MSIFSRTMPQVLDQQSIFSRAMPQVLDQQSILSQRQTVESNLWGQSHVTRRLRRINTVAPLSPFDPAGNPWGKLGVNYALKHCGATSSNKLKLTWTIRLAWELFMGSLLASILTCLYLLTSCTLLNTDILAVLNATQAWDTTQESNATSISETNKLEWKGKRIMDWTSLEFQKKLK